MILTRYLQPRKRMMLKHSTCYRPPSSVSTELGFRDCLKNSPAAIFDSDFVNAGGLMSYGADRFDMWRRAAVYVDKILKGTKPADLPVEQPTKFEFIVNLKAAKQIGVTIPPNVLVRADRVIR